MAHPEHIRAWTRKLAVELPNARPAEAVDPPAASLGRLLTHGFAGWVPHGAREPLPTAAIFAALVAVLHEAIVGGRVLRDWTAFTRFTGNALPLSLIFLSTWLTGLAISTMPWSEAPKLTPAAGSQKPEPRR